MVLFTVFVILFPDKMKKKNYDEDSENEFEVDEPEELQEDSDQEWAPAVRNS